MEHKSTFWGFLILFRHSAGLHCTSDEPITNASTYTQHRKTRTNIHALRGIRTHDHRDQAIKTYAFDLAATGIGNYLDTKLKLR
jgi:hypothetical protein